MTHPKERRERKEKFHDLEKYKQYTSVYKKM